MSGESSPREQEPEPEGPLRFFEFSPEVEVAILVNELVEDVARSWVTNLLEKMESRDTHFRFMATNDLLTELQKENIELDDIAEHRILRMLLRLLEDKNSEVRNLAVKCLGALAKKAQEYEVEKIVEALCTNMVSDKEQLRDISSIGLKTVIAELSQTLQGLSENICYNITGKLITAIERQEDFFVQLEALDILTGLLHRFGKILQSYHPSVLYALLPKLCSERQMVRKRTICACSNLVLSCNTALYIHLIEHLYNGMRTDNNNSNIKTYVQCVSAVCQQSGDKFGEHIDKFVPLIQAFSGVDDDETREICLQAFETFINRCPKEITSKIGAITDRCLHYLTHDPNYNYDENGDDKIMDTFGDEEEGEEYDDYSDDDDISWKVRRAAAKCLESIICTRHELISEFYKVMSPVLISRFKEREENVKSDIFHAYIALLRQTKVVNVNVDPNSMEQEEMPIYLLQQQVPMIVKCIQPQMKQKSMKTRHDCFELLKELCDVQAGALTHHIRDLMPGILFSLNEKAGSGNMKVDGLSFIHCLLTSHPPEVFYPHITTILPIVINYVGDSFYKIIAEALSVLQELVKLIRPLDRVSNFDYTPFFKDIYMCTLMRFKMVDIDQEVKEKSILTMSQVVCNLGDYLKNELDVCLPLFLDRLRNESTRLTTVKALTKISESPLHIELPILNEAVPVLGTFLRQKHRGLKLSTLQLIDCLIKKYHINMYVDLLNHIIFEVPPLLDESDLHIAEHTLVILKSIAEYQPRAFQNLAINNIFPRILILVKSPLLQGSALNSMLDFFRTLVQRNLPGLGYDNLLQFFITPVSFNRQVGAGDARLHKQAYYSLAKCVAAITAAMQPSNLHVVPQFVNQIRTAVNDSQKIFALLVVGEIGREIDLSSFPNLDQIISEAFSAVSEKVKSAASYALGSIAIGNLQQYLPSILKEDEEDPRCQYLLLHSLKEVITCLSSTLYGIQQLRPFVPAIWQNLFQYTASEEEGTRNVVAECLRKLTLIDPINLLPKLIEPLSSDSSLTRTTIITAIKLTISDQPASIDSLLRQCIGVFLNTLEDPDLNVRRVAFVAFNSVAYNKPSLIRDSLNSILPRLYHETNVKPDLKREVEMGPFKHTVDDGLDLRKAAFECMYTLLDSCFDKINIFEFIHHVELGLEDHYDIKMLMYLMVSKLSTICPGAVLQSLDRLVEPIKETCMMKVKEDAVKQEFEKQNELKRSALRAVVALLSIPDADTNQTLSDFVVDIKTSPELAPIFRSVQNYSTNDLFPMDQS